MSVSLGHLAVMVVAFLAIHSRTARCLPAAAEPGLLSEEVEERLSAGGPEAAVSLAVARLSRVLPFGAESGPRRVALRWIAGGNPRAQSGATRRLRTQALLFRPRTVKRDQTPIEDRQSSGLSKPCFWKYCI